MVATINASVSSSGIVSTADGSGILKVQSNGVTTNALAWVNFDGTIASPTARSQYNVSSIVKNGTGDYSINFSNALADANYSVAATSSNLASSLNSSWIGPYTTKSTTAIRVQVSIWSTTRVVIDGDQVSVAIFGN